MSRVARYHADRTNQKLYFARLACTQASATDNLQQAQACRENAVFQLQGAVLAYYQELARYYKLDDRQPTLNSLRDKLALRGQVSPEVTILQQLSDTGYLSALNQAYAACRYAPEPAEPTYEDELTANKMITKVAQAPLAWLPEVETLRTWHKSLLQLIDRFRDEMIEF